MHHLAGLSLGGLAVAIGHGLAIVVLLLAVGRADLGVRIPRLPFPNPLSRLDLPEEAFPEPRCEPLVDVVVPRRSEVDHHYWPAVRGTAAAVKSPAAEPTANSLTRGELMLSKSTLDWHFDFVSRTESSCRVR